MMETWFIVLIGGLILIGAVAEVRGWRFLLDLRKQSQNLHAILSKLESSVAELRQTTSVLQSQMEIAQRQNQAEQKRLNEWIEQVDEKRATGQQQTMDAIDGVGARLTTETGRLSGRIQELVHQCDAALAIAQMAGDDLEGAQVTLRAVLAQRPDHPVALVLLGQCLNTLGRFQTCWELVEPGLSKDKCESTAEDLLCIAGQALRGLRQAPQAEQLHRDALEKNPRAPRVLNELGLDLLGQEKFLEARDVLAEALQCAAHQPEVRYNYGIALMECGEAHMGIEYLRQAVESSPGRIAWVRALALALLRNGSHGAAAEALSRVVQVEPCDGDAWAGLATAWRGLGRWEEAAQAAAKATSLQPDSAMAWIEQGLVDIGLGRLAEGYQALEKACVLAPDDPDPVCALAQLCSLDNKPDRAAQLYDQALKLQSDKTELYQMQAEALTTGGQSTEAVAVLAKAVADHPEQGDLYLAAARAQLLAGMWEEAGTMLARGGPHLGGKNQRLAGAYLGLVVALRRGTCAQVQEASERIIRFVERAPETVPITGVSPLEPMALYRAGFGADEVAYHEAVAQLLTGKLELSDFHETTDWLLSRIETARPEPEET